MGGDMRRSALLVLGLVIAGCAGKLDYVPPASLSAQPNAKTVAKSKDQVWEQLIPALSSRFFVINNIDKASGLINISYSGDPERYVHCGTVTSYVKNARGERTYSFPGSRASQTYEVMTDNLYFIERTMALDGRMNIVVQANGAGATNITVNTRYVLTRNQKVTSAAGGFPQNFSHSINMNTGQGSSFPTSSSLPPLQCVPNGTFESEVLGLVN
jgi:hypothetical protein